jgi:hypothetical protein
VILSSPAIGSSKSPRVISVILLRRRSSRWGAGLGPHFLPNQVQLRDQSAMLEEGIQTLLGTQPLRCLYQSGLELFRNFRLHMSRLSDDHSDFIACPPN